MTNDLAVVAETMQKEGLTSIAIDVVFDVGRHAYSATPHLLGDANVAISRIADGVHAAIAADIEANEAYGWPVSGELTITLFHGGTAGISGSYLTAKPVRPPKVRVRMYQNDGYMVVDYE